MYNRKVMIHVKNSLFYFTRHPSKDLYATIETQINNCTKN